MTFSEEVILNLDRPGVCLALRLVLGDQTTIFCLQTNDSIHRSAVSNENCALATEKSSRFQREHREEREDMEGNYLPQRHREHGVSDLLNVQNSGTPCPPGLLGSGRLLFIVFFPLRCFLATGWLWSFLEVFRFLILLRLLTLFSPDLVSPRPFRGAGVIPGPLFFCYRRSRWWFCAFLRFRL